MFKTYYQLTKPGIIYGNALTAAAGFLLAAKRHINLALFLETLLGISFIIASACVINNYLDRDIDNKMERTKNRALVTGKISGKNAIIFGTILGLIGALTLGFFTNILALVVCSAGWFVYVALYTPLKRYSVYSTLVGAVSGAFPPVAGYCAVTNRFDAGAIILFFILIFWQMPHFYAIGIFRLKDYAAAGMPILPVKSGIKVTKIHMLMYILAFLTVSVLLHVRGFAGHTYLIVMCLLGIVWLGLCLKGFSKNTNDPVWAKKLFLYSLIVITTFCVIIPIDALIKNKL